MKFHQLAIGTQFEFAGKRCIKTSPVMASEVDSGKPVFMKRSSVVIIDSPEARAPSPAQGSGDRLHDALTAYRRQCLQLIHHRFPDLDESELTQVDEALAQVQDDIQSQFS